MNAVTDIRPVSALKEHPAELIAQARDRKSPIIITQHGQATAVLHDVGSFERTRKALLLLRLAVEGDQAHARGRRLTNARALARLRARLIER